MNNHLDTFEEFVDDILNSDVDLLKGELDFLIFQHLFQSIDLNVIRNTAIDNKDSLAA